MNNMNFDQDTIENIVLVAIAVLTLVLTVYLSVLAIGTAFGQTKMWLEGARYRICLDEMSRVQVAGTVAQECYRATH